MSSCVYEIHPRHGQCRVEYWFNDSTIVTDYQSYIGIRDGLCVKFEFFTFSQNIVYIADFKLEYFPAVNYMFNIF